MNLNTARPVENEPGPTSSPVAPTSPGPPGRFTYATGARPLPGYTIKRGIGHGGFGEVYYATSDAGKEVALKLIRRNLDVELRGVTQCLNLKHPNLLSLYDVRTDDQGDNWVVMELMTGESLEQMVARHPNGMPQAEALAWIHGIAAGLAYLHDHGIVHRDLKPGNIFADEGLVKIGDYGLSKFISCSRRSGQTGSVGTVHYMAPEVANGRYGKEIDIYALGVILYEVVTGHVPFEGESIGEILMKHLTAEPDVSGLEEPYRTIVARCLAKDPDQRFPSVRDLIAMLPPAPAGATVHFAGPHPAVGRSPGSAAGAGSEPRRADSTDFSLGPKVSPESSDAQVVDPIARWVRDNLSKARVWWEGLDLLPWQKLFLSLVAFLVVFKVASNAPPSLWQMLLGAVIFYLIYRVAFGYTGRARVARRPASYPSEKPRTAAASPPLAPGERLNTRFHASPTRRHWRERRVTPSYQLPQPRERITQLVGSLLLSSIVCAVVALVMLILRGETPNETHYAWLAASSILGSWAVLVPAKFWEGTHGDAALRRFVMLVAGLVFGLAAYGLCHFWFVSLDYDATFHLGPAIDLRSKFFAADGEPLLLAFLAYFAFLFVVPRWWRLADPLRSSRLSIWHTGVAVFWAAAISAFWPFPQPWGMMLAATIAIAVQLASPWVSPAERLPAKEEG